MIDNTVLPNISEALNTLAETLLTKDNPSETDVEVAEQLIDLSTILNDTNEKVEEVLSHLRVIAAFAQVANLNERNEQVAEYDPDLADVLQTTAIAIIDWDSNE